MIISNEELQELIDRQNIVVGNDYGRTEVRRIARNLIAALIELKSRREADNVVKEASKKP